MTLENFVEQATFLKVLAQFPHSASIIVTNKPKIFCLFSESWIMFKEIVFWVQSHVFSAVLWSVIWLETLSVTEFISLEVVWDGRCHRQHITVVLFVAAAVHDSDVCCHRCVSAAVDHVSVVYYLLSNLLYTQYSTVHFFLLCVFIFVASVWHRYLITQWYSQVQVLRSYSSAAWCPVSGVVLHDFCSFGSSSIHNSCLMPHAIFIPMVLFIFEMCVTTKDQKTIKFFSKM